MRICWFTTGRDEEALLLFKDILSAIDGGLIEGKIPLLFLNRNKGDGPFVDRIIEEAEKRSIPCELLSSRGFIFPRDRVLFDSLVKKRLENYEFDIIFLAGYMLIVSFLLFDSYTILNLHPSLPGTYKGSWEEVIEKVIENKDKTYGAMVHLVTERLDEGPPVTYVKFDIEGVEEYYDRIQKGERQAYIELFKKIRNKEFSLERPLILKTLSLISKREIEIKGREVFFKGERVTGGIDLTSLIDDEKKDIYK